MQRNPNNVYLDDAVEQYVTYRVINSDTNTDEAHRIASVLEHFQFWCEKNVDVEFLTVSDVGNEIIFDYKQSLKEAYSSEEVTDMIFLVREFLQIVPYISDADDVRMRMDDLVNDFIDNLDQDEEDDVSEVRLNDFLVFCRQYHIDAVYDVMQLRSLIHEYLSTLSESADDLSFEDFASLRGLSIWASRTQAKMSDCDDSPAQGGEA